MEAPPTLLLLLSERFCREQLKHCVEGCDVEEAYGLIEEVASHLCDWRARFVG